MVTLRLGLCVAYSMASLPGSAMCTGKPLHVRHVHWTAFRIDPNLQAQWLQDPTSLPVSTAVQRDEQETSRQHLSSMLARLDGVLGTLRRRMRRNETKISRALGRGATSGKLDRLQQKAAKIRYCIEEVRDKKRRLLEPPDHERLHLTSTSSPVAVSCAPRARCLEAVEPHDVLFAKGFITSDRRTCGKDKCGSLSFAQNSCNATEDLRCHRASGRAEKGE